MKTLRIVFFTLALLVGAGIVAYKSRAVIIFGTPVDSAKTETPTTGVFSSNNVSFSVNPIAGKAMLDLTVITNYQPDLLRWLAYNFFVSSNGIDYVEIAGYGQSIADTNNHMTYWYDVTGYPLYWPTQEPTWWIVQAIDGCCPNYVNPVVLGYYPTNVIGRTSVTNVPGDLLWLNAIKGTNGSHSVTARSVACDHSGNVISVGGWQGSVNFGNGPVYAGFQGMYIVKRNASGGFLWAKTFTSYGYDVATSVAVDSADNVIVTGGFQGTVDFSGTGAAGASLTNVYGYDIFVAKYNSGGTNLWAKGFGGRGDDVGLAVAVDTNDTPFISFQFQSPAMIMGLYSVDGGISHYNIGLARLTSAGGVLWAKSWGGDAESDPYAIAIDPSSDLWVTGDFYGSLDLGGGTSNCLGSVNMFIAKYSGTDGSYQWAKMIGSTGVDHAKSIAVDPVTGKVVFSGSFNGSVNFGGGAVASGVTSTLFMAGYNNSGGYLWCKHYGGDPYLGGDSGNALKVDATGISLTGVFNSWMDWNNDGLEDAGGGGFFAGRFSASGTNTPSLLWARRDISRFGHGSGVGLDMDSLGHIVVTGSFTGLFNPGGIYVDDSIYQGAFVLQYQK